MPTYKYKCTVCDHEEFLSMRISVNPSTKVECPDCWERADTDELEPTMTRRIVASSIPESVGKVWAGDWFKKTYGHDIGEASQAAADSRAAYEREKADLEAKGIRMRHQSRQLDGKNRISLREKDE